MRMRLLFGNCWASLATVRQSRSRRRKETYGDELIAGRNPPPYVSLRRRLLWIAFEQYSMCGGCDQFHDLNGKFQISSLHQHSSNNEQQNYSSSCTSSRTPRGI